MRRLTLPGLVMSLDIRGIGLQSTMMFPVLLALVPMRCSALSGRRQSRSGLVPVLLFCRTISLTEWLKPIIFWQLYIPEGLIWELGGPLEDRQKHRWHFQVIFWKMSGTCLKNLMNYYSFCTMILRKMICTPKSGRPLFLRYYHSHGCLGQVRRVRLLPLKEGCRILSAIL